MKPPDFLKNLPAPTRMLFRPMLMMSLVLHGAVLMLPIPSDLDKPKPPKKQEQVKITQLPRTRSSPKLSPQSSSKPNPQPSPQPSQSTRSNEATPPDFLPELTTQFSPQLSESTRLNELTLPESSLKPNPQPSPQPSESTPAEPNQQSANPIISQANPKQNPSSQPKPEESDSSRAKPAPEESDSSNFKSSESPPSNPAPNTETNPDDTKAKDPLEDFLNNFPFPDNANVGSLGVLSKDADESARNVKQPLEGVIKYYGKELPVRKYSTLTSPMEDDAALKVYQVYKGSAYQYLHLISKEEDTIIFLSQTKLSRTDLANLEVETAQQRELKDILRETISVASKKELPSDIKSKLGDGKYIILGIFPGENPKQIGDDFINALRKKEYQVFPFGKELYYGVKKDTFTGYIQLIPSSDGTGTAIILLEKISP